MSKMSAQASGKAAKPVASSVHFPRITKHDLEVVVEAMDKLREALRVEEEAKPPEVPAGQREWSGEALDRLRKDLKHEPCFTCEGEFGLPADRAVFICAQCAGDELDPEQIAAPPSVDGLEAQLRKFLDTDAWCDATGYVQEISVLAAFIRTRDRELVENLEGLAEKWEKENSLRSDDSYRYPQQLRAVLAARNEGGK